jgi:hypothetical protein
LSQKINIKRLIFSTVYKNLTYNLQQIRYTALIPNRNDEVEYFKVDSKGYPTPKKTAYANKEVTIIVGHRERNNLMVTPDDLVFTGIFGNNGRLSSVGKGLESQELTVIVHIKE